MTEVPQEPFPGWTAAADAFHAHLDVCAQCANHPFQLCPVGAALLVATAQKPKPKSLLDWGPDGLYDDTRAVHLHGLCHAARDGECSWRQCPQRKSYKTHCPLDKEIRDED